MVLLPMINMVRNGLCDSKTDYIINNPLILRTSIYYSTLQAVVLFLPRFSDSIDKMISLLLGLEPQQHSFCVMGTDEFACELVIKSYEMIRMDMGE